jgi:hypothetical protein
MQSILLLWSECDVKSNIRRKESSMLNHARNVFGVLLLVIVFALALLLTTNQFVGVYEAVALSPNESLAAGLVAGGTILLCVLFPGARHAGKVFAGLSALTVVAVATNAAIPLGLIPNAPLGWRNAILIAASLPIALGLWMSREMLLSALSTLTPTLTPTPTLPATPARAALEDSSEESIRMKISIPQIASRVGVDTDSESDSDTDSVPDSVPLDVLYETLSALKYARGNVAAAAKRMNMSRTGVNKRVRMLYGIDPDRVAADVPEWVDRNYGARVS